MAHCLKSGHKDKVNKLLTILALALLPCPALAAGVALPASVMILVPTADIDYSGDQQKIPINSLNLSGQAGQVIRYTIGDLSGLVVLNADGVGSVNLSKHIAANAEYLMSYD
jgi:hypothetical protein